MSLWQFRDLWCKEKKARYINLHNHEFQRLCDEVNITRKNYLKPIPHRPSLTSKGGSKPVIYKYITPLHGKLLYV
jgi:hypothetical protein